MKTCGFADFIQVLQPWLDSEYIRSADRDPDGNLRLLFVDGGEAVYRIDDCSEAQLRAVFARMKASGIRVETTPGDD